LSGILANSYYIREIGVTLTTDPLPVPKLGEREQLPEHQIYQGWLVYTDGSDLKPVFYTVEQFDFQWMQDNQHLLVIAGTSLAIHTISPRYVTGCEGSFGYRIAPDGQHLIYEPDIVTTIDGAEQMRICGEGKNTHSYTWSQDGQYAYAVCSSSEDESHVLRRYDTWTSENRILVDQTCVTFKAMDVTISPDQTRVAFVWGTNGFFNTEPYGVWILDLAQLDDCQ
jgi:hypothetical protein